MFQFITKVFDGVKVRALCRPVKFFHTDLDKPFLYGPCFAHMGIVMLKQERAFPNCCHKVGSIESSRMSLYAVAFKFAFTGTKGPSLNHDNRPRPLFFLHQTLVGTMHWGRYRAPCICQTVIHHSRECVSTAPESNGCKLYTDARPWKPIS